MPWGVMSITNSSRYNAQRDKSLSCIIMLLSVSLLGRPPRCGHLVNSTKELRNSLRLLRRVMSSLGMTLGTALLSLVRSRVVAQLERCDCPILYPHAPKL